MKLSSMPSLVAVPFADQGTKNTIPVDSQIGVKDGAASYTDGFPPLTMTPVVAGGIPPAGDDFNGILNAITQSLRWACAGGQYKYDSAFSAAVGGYPKGAMLQNDAGDILWLNTLDDNTANPDAGPEWIPAIRYGLTSLALAGTAVTLTPAQAAKETIILTGTLTANVQLIMPAWVETWLIVNNTTGNFVVSVKTSAGSGVNIAAGSSSQVYGDGTNIYYGALLVRNNLAEIKAAGSNSQAAARDNLGLKSAATHDVTTSPSDTTAGHLMQVGDGGLMGRVLSATDANLTDKVGLASMLFKQGGGSGTSHFGGFGAGAHLEYGDSGDISMTLSANIFITSTGEVVTEWMGVNKSTGVVTSTIKRYLSTDGGVVKGRITVAETGAAIIIQPDTAGQPVYILGKDSDGTTNLFYLGKGSANINDVLLNNYKGGNNSVKLSESGEVWIQPTSGHNAIVNGILEIRTAAPEMIFNETDTGKKYILVGDGNDFRLDEDSTAGNNVWKWTSGTNILTVNGEVVPANYANFDARYYTQSAANAKFVQGVQLGARALSASSNASGGNLYLPTGCVATGYTSPGSSDANDVKLYYKPIQRNINGTWATISG